MAIAFDASSTDTGWTSPRTFSHTCTGSNLILFIATNVNTASAVTITVTYNWVSATQVNSQVVSWWWTVFLHYLVAPATWANNIVVTRTSWAWNIIASATSYTWVSATWQLDNSGVRSQASTTSYSQSLTTVVDNCWLVMAWSGANAAVLTAWTGTVVRVQDNAFAWLFICDSWAATTPAWSDSLTVTSSSQSYGSVMASFRVDGYTSTAIKTVDWLAYASVKSVKGLAVASIKNINWLA